MFLGDSMLITTLTLIQTVLIAIIYHQTKMMFSLKLVASYHSQNIATFETNVTCRNFDECILCRYPAIKRIMNHALTKNVFA